MITPGKNPQVRENIEWEWDGNKNIKQVLLLFGKSCSIWRAFSIFFRSTFKVRAQLKANVYVLFRFVLRGALAWSACSLRFIRCSTRDGFYTLRHHRAILTNTLTNTIQYASCGNKSYFVVPIQGYSNVFKVYAKLLFSVLLFYFLGSRRARRFYSCYLFCLFHSVESMTTIEAHGGWEIINNNCEIWLFTNSIFPLLSSLNKRWRVQNVRRFIFRLTELRPFA